MLLNLYNIIIGVRTGAANAAFAAPDNLFWIQWAGRYLFEMYNIIHRMNNFKHIEFINKI